MKSYRYTQFITPSLREKLDVIARRYDYHPYHIHRFLEIEFGHVKKERRHGIWDEIYRLAEVKPGAWHESRANEEIEKMLRPSSKDITKVLFKKLEIRNFGIFKSASLHFSSDDARNITLVGGMNESGKTTLFNAILTALYGVQHGWQERRQSPPVPNSEDGNKCQVETKLTLIVPDVGETKIERIFTYERDASGAWRLSESSSRLYTPKMSLAGDKEVDSQVESFLPRSLSQYFLFDADGIRDFLGHQADALRAGLGTVLGLDIARTAEEDLKELEERYKSDLAKNSGIEARLKEVELEVKKTQNEINKLNESIREHEQEKKAKERELDRLDDELGRITKLFNPDQYQYLAELEGRKKDAQTRLQGAQLEIQKAIKDKLVPSLLKPILEKVKDDLDKPFYGVVRPIHETRNRANEVFVRQGYDLKYLDYIFEPLKDYMVPKSTVPNLADLSARDRKELERTFEGGLAKSHLSKFIWDYKKASLELEESESKIRKLRPPDPTIAKDFEDLKRKRDKVIRDHESARLEVQRLRDSLNECEKKIAELQKQREDLLTTYSTSREAVRKYERITQFCKMVKEALQAFRESKVDELEYRTNEMWQKLSPAHAGDRRVKLNPENFEASIIEAGKQINFEQLSEGGKQILAMSLIAGLSKLSRESFPVVIDTPFGRLDTKHRTSLSREFLSSVSHQVLVFSTDQELVGDYLKQIEPCVGRYYSIDHDKEKKESILKEGYF